MQVAARHLLIAAFVAGAYALGSELAFAWFAADGTNASFFPAGGVTMAALVLLDRRWWPTALIAAGLAEFVVDVAHSIPFLATLGYVVANLVQPLVGVSVLRRVQPRVDLARLTHLTAFLLSCVVLGPLVGSLLGATNNAIHGGDDWLQFVVEWWVGDGLGVLVAGTTLITLWSSRRTILRRGAIEPLALITVMAGVTMLAFALELYALLYLPIVMLFMIAVRLGTWAVAVGGTSVAFIAAEATARGNRWWSDLGQSDSVGLLYLQLALLVIIASALVVAAGASEREASTAAFALAEASRREAELARLRAEFLWELSEELAQASTPSEIARSLWKRRLEDSWPAGMRFPPVESSIVRPEDLERDLDGIIDHQAVRDSGVRMTRDALQRVRLVAEERRARERAELLEHHAANLAAAGDPAAVAEVTVNDVASLGADYTAVWALESSHVTVLATLHVTLGADASNGVLPIGADLPVTRCATTGEMVVCSTNDELLTTFPSLAEFQPQLASSASLIAVPLTALDDSVIGALVVADSTPHWLTETRRQLVLGLAGQCGLALDRAELQARAAQAAADADQVARLSELLDKETTVEARAHCLADHLVRLGAGEVEIDLPGGRQVIAHAPSPAADDGRVLILPLHARGEVIGQLRVRGSELLDARGHVVRDIAARAAIAIDNAQLYEGEREASHRLQLGLLDFSTPDVDDCRIDVAYRPGVSNLEVGGDWHDAFLLPDGSLGLVVGDVVGHGLDSAAAMGQLRGAVRALAAVSSPAQLLERLDSFVESLPAAFMTTLVYVELDPATGVMRYACAGHPPPLIVSAAGESQLVWDARSAPLGAQFGGARTEAVGLLADGERLVLYTDGLVERRGEEIDIGLARLLEASQHDVSSPDFVDRLCAELVGVESDDDVCVLAVTLLRAQSFATLCPSDPEHLAELRRGMRTWLASLECDDDNAFDIVLAVSEAVANSIEHGASETGRGVSVFGRLEDGVISVVIRDHGRWKAPGPPSLRGRGIPIMRHVMDSVSVEPSEDGTLVRLSVAMVPAPQAAMSEFA